MLKKLGQRLPLILLKSSGTVFSFSIQYPAISIDGGDDTPFNWSIVNISDLLSSRIRFSSGGSLKLLLLSQATSRKRKYQRRGRGKQKSLLLMVRISRKSVEFL